MIRNLILYGGWLILYLLSLPLAAQPVVYSFEEAEGLMGRQKRPLLVFIHTEWCRYCKGMEQTTFRDEALIEWLNEKFYFIKLDGEEKGEIRFRDHTFRFQPTGKGTGVHELAEQLGTLEGKLSYPTLCVLNAEFEIIFQHPFFIRPAELLRALDRLLRN